MRASPPRIRLVVLYVLVGSLLVSLAGRLWFLQIMDGKTYQRIAAANRTREIIVPAVRGQILDDVGRPLVRNRTALVVSVDRTALTRQPDGGVTVLKRLAKVLGRPYSALAEQVRLCGPNVPRPCWPGSPYQPIPVADNVDPRAALQIKERHEDFPGVSAQVQPVLDYPAPDGVSAAHVLGYLQPVTQDELNRRAGLKAQFSGVDLIGRDGLEAVYDEQLRGQAGARVVSVDSSGTVTGVAREQPPRPGDHLVTSIDAKVQAAAEQALDHAVARARQQGGKGDSAAAVVLDVRTGRVVALASYPTYDPSVWIGGISQKEYENLLSDARGKPLISRAFQGQFAPGSTFKVSSLVAAVNDGNSLSGSYDCPGSFRVGDREFKNFEGEAFGRMDLHRAIVVSCDTIFYQFAYDEWLRDGGTHPGRNPKDPMVRTARAFGFGAPTGIDLPNEAAGRIPDRAWKYAYWKATKDEDCKRAKTGYPDVARSDPARAAFLKALAAENCQDGYVWRAGDAANFAIGQGDVLVTPLQLARAYAAIANGGTLFSPRVGRALVRPDGQVVQEIVPPKVGRVPVSQQTLDYLRRALVDVVRSGTARGSFAGFPLDRVPVAGKTGTAEVYGKQDTSVFASYAPADDPQFAVVVLVTQGGTGADVAAPAAREIYDAIYGLEGHKAALPGGKPPATLPRIGADGVIGPPDGFQQVSTAAPSPPAGSGDRLLADPPQRRGGLR